MIGSQPQRIVVTPSLFIFGMRLAAWFDIVSRFSWYWMFGPVGPPASCTILRATWTDSWYQEFSGAIDAILRGLLARSPPAYLAGFACPPGPSSRLIVYSAASLATVVPSTARLQM